RVDDGAGVAVFDRVLTYLQVVGQRPRHQTTASHEALSRIAVGFVMLPNADRTTTVPSVLMTPPPKLPSESQKNARAVDGRYGASRVKIVVLVTLPEVAVIVAPV